jgi:NADH:ubiquinone oxidoreductase, NADH-binding (51 kD) subunit
MTTDELQQISTIEQETQGQYQHHVCVCVAAGCLSSQADVVQESLAREIERQGMGDKCHIKGVGCMGLCSRGPLVSVDPEGVLYQNVKPSDSSEIIESLGKEKVSRLECSTEIPFFQHQKKIVLENSGLIDPNRIEEYIAVGGYGSLVTCLTEMTPSEVIDEIIKSGLRGRGGARISRQA